jgi:single-strand DNA-binding protein
MFIILFIKKEERNMNKVLLMGRLTREPEIRYGNDKKPIARYAIAVDRSYKDSNGNYPTDFFNLVSFGGTASFVEKYLKKGTKIVAEGELRNNNYEKDGNKVYSDQIVVTNVEFAESKKASGEGQSAPAQAPASQEADGGFNEVPDATPDELPFV